MNKRVISGLMICSLALMAIAGPTAAAADTIDQQIDQQDQKISDLQNQQTTTQAKIDTLETELAEVNDKVQTLEAAQTKLNDETTQLQSKIATLNVRIAKREQAIQKQARDVQVNGQSSNFIDAVLDAESLSDAVQRVEAMATIVNANNDLVKQQKQDKQTVVDEVKENEQKIAELAANQKELATQKSTIANKQAELKVLKTTLAADQATAENEKASLQKQKQAAIEEAARVAKQQAEAKAAREAQEAKEAAALKQAQETAAAKAKAATKASETTADTTAKDTAAKDTTADTTTTVADDATSSSSTKADTTDTEGSSEEVTVSDDTETTSTGGAVDHSGEANAYAVGQCTWYVKHVAPWAGTYWGNGCQWGASAAADGYTVNSTPAAGAIVVFAAGQAVGSWNASSQYGHVAYVESYDAASNTITISQGGMGFSSPTGPNTQTISASGLQYIHR